VNVLIVGSGAREHALAWKLRQSDKLSDLFITPGNPGTAALGRNLSIRELDFDGIGAAAREHHVELVVVGPEVPLAAGLVDYLSERGVAAYGPTRAASRIEASKVWAKELMLRHGIPTAPASAFDDAEAARRFVLDTPVPPVVKADGLAAGKGVVVARNQTEALQAIEQAMTMRTFGDAGEHVLLEERISGREVSAHAFCDGARALPIPFACDHKPVFDGDRGPNTGGMGAYSPPRFIDERLAAQIHDAITAPTLAALVAEGSPYCGTLYPGLMITDAGPKVIEFNCRFGDPETQVLLPRLRSDLLPILLACARGDLRGVEPVWDDGACVGVVLASGGYPGSYTTGHPIDGLDVLDEDVQVFHAGTALSDGRVLTAGGRVVTVVARGATIAAARERVYDNVRRIAFDGVHFRTDIGLRELER
jgi:phosphoribosylamine---glycine ligase